MKEEKKTSCCPLEDAELESVTGGNPGGGLLEDEEWQYCWNKTSCPMKYWTAGASNEAKRTACELHNCASQDLGMGGKVYCGK